MAFSPGDGNYFMLVVRAHINAWMDLSIALISARAKLKTARKRDLRSSVISGSYLNLHIEDMTRRFCGEEEMEEI